MLTDLAACLKRQFRGSDVIGRIGGDEFAVFLSSLSQASDAGVKAGKSWPPSPPCRWRAPPTCSSPAAWASPCARPTAPTTSACTSA
ncbi:diguanylate cyclase domain-containing protein, partial [Intestinimonas massiliensis (ex Afouda et al. 2020)]|uniref:diguanylate cyclase domain-containing protein n=1 Tax=Intestinimonas massiliensis (ex Afouda et al. 2020) TaxID=1673721 RepID=UPI003F68AF29